MSEHILMTGGSGFIGSHFSEMLNRQKITIFDLKVPAFQTNAKFVQGDIRDEPLLKKTFKESKSTLILHLAAAHQDFGIPRDEYFSVNEGGAKAIVAAAKANGIQKIIFYSSVAVFGDSLEPSTDKAKPSPTNAYGASKLAAEEVFTQWANEDPSRLLIIVRPAVVYGENNFANMYRLIQQIAKKRYAHIGEGNNVKSIAYVKNLISATLFMYAQTVSGIHTFTYADEPQMTSREIAERIHECLGLGGSLRTLPLKFALFLATPFDVLSKLTGKNLPISRNRVRKFSFPTHHKAKAIQKAGFGAKYSNLDGIKNMVDWYRINTKG